jgi:hypothetical protein
MFLKFEHYDLAISEVSHYGFLRGHFGFLKGFMVVTTTDGRTRPIRLLSIH